jgi:chromosome segregation ATPase
LKETLASETSLTLEEVENRLQYQWASVKKKIDELFLTIQESCLSVQFLNSEREQLLVLIDRLDKLEKDAEPELRRRSVQASARKSHLNELTNRLEQQFNDLSALKECLYHDLMHPKPIEATDIEEKSKVSTDEKHETSKENTGSIPSVPSLLDEQLTKESLSDPSIQLSCLCIPDLLSPVEDQDELWRKKMEATKTAIVRRESWSAVKHEQARKTTPLSAIDNTEEDSDWKVFYWLEQQSIGNCSVVLAENKLKFHQLPYLTDGQLEQLGFPPELREQFLTICRSIRKLNEGLYLPKQTNKKKRFFYSTL